MQGQRLEISLEKQICSEQLANDHLSARSPHDKRNSHEQRIQDESVNFEVTRRHSTTNRYTRSKRRPKHNADSNINAMKKSSPPHRRSANAQQPLQLPRTTVPTGLPPQR